MNMTYWLKHPGVQQLLQALIDRIDDAQAQGKPVVRGIPLDAKTLPALYNAKLELEKEELWGYIDNLVKMGWLSLQLDRDSGHQAGYERRPRVKIMDESSVRAAAGRPTRIKPASELWKEAVCGFLRGTEAVQETVTRYRLEIPGRPAIDIVNRLNLLGALKDESLSLREVSSRLFWGASKVLDKRGALVAAILGLDECPFPEMPIHLQVYLPEGGFEGVLFIENLTTFEQAVRVKQERFKRLALIYASGFKGSARRVRTDGGSSVFFAEWGTLELMAREKFLSWLRSDNEMLCWFWGDLDYAGMDILRTLRQSFPNAEAWSLGYSAMLSELTTGGGHQPDEAGKGAQKKVLLTGCSYADLVLLPAIQSTGRFVDQEVA
jgi:hypothetical protein